jgi:predicted ArsR family transcriptional regulator
MLKIEKLTNIQQNLYDILRINGDMTRKQLKKELNIPRTTIYDNLVKLQKRKLIEKYSKNNGKRGRPKVFWKIK